MDLQLNGHHVAVVGGAHGIGWAIAEAFSAEGAHVAVLDLDAEAAETKCQDISERHGVSAFACRVDVCEASSLRDADEVIRKRFPSLQHLVYAAGAGSGKFGFPFWNLDADDWPRVLDVNLTGAVRTLHQFTPWLRTEDTGSVLFLASIAGQIGSQTDPPYSAAKAGLLNWTQCAAKDLAADQIRVNAICPGMVKTAINQSVWRAWQAGDPESRTATYDEWAEEKIRTVAPLGNWQTPEEIAALAVFLASPLARNITGQTLNVDGGQVMHS